jgi:hypothetical protein
VRSPWQGDGGFGRSTAGGGSHPSVSVAGTLRKSNSPSSTSLFDGGSDGLDLTLLGGTIDVQSGHLKIDVFVADMQVTVNVRSAVPTYDLSVTDITAPATGRPGETVSIAYTVRNLSENAVGGSWFDSAYLSSDTSFELDDLLMGRVAHLGGIAAGATYDETVHATLPAVADGNYYVIVVADSRGIVPDRPGVVSMPRAST